MKFKNKSYIAFALLAAALYALNMPVSKLLLDSVAPTMMAALLYLGAGLGLLAVSLTRRALKRTANGAALTKEELPSILGMIVLDILAPIFLMMGLKTTTPENASLLNNFEIVATAIIALVLFRESVTKRLWLAIGLITLSSLLLSVESIESFRFSTGSLLVLAACLCWGFENNCTRMLSSKDTTQIVIIKGLCSGLGSLVIAFIAGETLPMLGLIVATLFLGFVAYGLSIYFYILAQRGLGAAKTSAYYAIAPFLSVVFSFIIFREAPKAAFYPALMIMAVGCWLTARSSSIE